MTGLHAGKSLLPDNATPWERALSLTSADARDIDAQAIVRAFDPWSCPVDLLPWLAHTFSLDYWRAEWPENKKRRVIARAVQLHFLKGTEQALRDYVDLADAKVLDIVTPPAKIFSGPSLTVAEREAWLSALPQIRVWRVGEPGTAGLRLFSGGVSMPRFFNGRFAQPSSASTRLQRRARWVVDGVESPARVVTAPDGFVVLVPGESGQRVFCNARPARRFFQPSEAASRMFVVGPDTQAPWRSPLTPRLEPVSVRPTRVVEPGVRHHRVMSGLPIGGSFFQPSSAWRHIFLRYAVHDGRPVARRSPVQFMGVGRYGWPAHTAMVRLSIPGRRSPWQAGEGLFVPRTRFWLPHDPSRVMDVRRAIRAGMRHSDRILLAMGPQPRFVAGHRFLADVDQYVVGGP